MTGPDHYAEAERLLNIAEASRSQEQLDHATARAQVHATLALAAATLHGRMSSSEDANPWREAVT